MLQHPVPLHIVSLRTKWSLTWWRHTRQVQQLLCQGHRCHELSQLLSQGDLGPKLYSSICLSNVRILKFVPCTSLITCLFGTCNIRQPRPGDYKNSGKCTYRRAQSILRELNFEPEVMLQQAYGKLSAVVS